MPAPTSQLRLVGAKRSDAPALDAPFATDPMNVAGLFAGIGGIELGLARAGHESNLLCEIEPAAIAVLEERFPSVPKQRDVSAMKSLPRSTDLVA